MSLSLLENALKRHPLSAPCAYKLPDYFLQATCRWRNSDVRDVRLHKLTSKQYRRLQILSSLTHNTKTVLISLHYITLCTSSKLLHRVSLLFLLYPLTNPTIWKGSFWNTICMVVRSSIRSLACEPSCGFSSHFLLLFTSCLRSLYSDLSEQLNDKANFSVVGQPDLTGEASDSSAWVSVHHEKEPPQCNTFKDFIYLK